MDCLVDALEQVGGVRRYYASTDCEGDDATTVKEWQRRRWRVAGRKEHYWGCGARTSEAAAAAIAGTAAATKANTVTSRSVDSKQVCEYAIIAIAQLLAFVDHPS